MLYVVDFLAKSHAGRPFLVESELKSGGSAGQKAQMSPTEAHDLTRDAQADAAPLRLGTEEGDEDVGGGLGRNLRAAVAHLDDHGFCLVAVGADADFAGVLLHGLSGWSIG